MELVYYSIGVGVLALVYAGYLARKVGRIKVEDRKILEISDAIREGAMAFLNREYQVLLAYMAVMAGILGVALGSNIGVTFLIGGALSILAGNIGMRMSTKANVRAVQGVKESMNAGLDVAFSSGLVMGLICCRVCNFKLHGITINKFVATLHGFDLIPKC